MWSRYLRHVLEDTVAAIPDAELDRRVVFTLDQCVIDQREFYLRGRIPVPVIGRHEPFIPPIDHWGLDFFRVLLKREADTPIDLIRRRPDPSETSQRRDTGRDHGRN